MLPETNTRCSFGVTRKRRMGKSIQAKRRFRKRSVIKRRKMNLQSDEQRAMIRNNRGIMIVNISKPEKYYRQNNNELSPLIRCKPTATVECLDLAGMGTRKSYHWKYTAMAYDSQTHDDIRRPRKVGCNR